MAFYYIRTLLAPRRTSLLTAAEYQSDVAAICAARRFLRRDEAVEVWRDDTLVYRVPSNAARS